MDGEMTGEPVLELEGIRKTYRGVFHGTVALRGVNLRLPPGSITGLIGPNGSGKSTLILTALGYLRPDRGIVRIFGRAVADLSARRRVGWVPEHPIHRPGMRGARFVEHALAAHGVSRRDRRARTKALFERFDLSWAAERRMGGYSRGMLQKTALIGAVAHGPDLLLLDEPTSGMDPVGIRQVRETLHEFRGRGGAALVSSHLLSELMLTCDRALFMSGGRIVREEDLGGGRRGRTVSLEASDPGALRRALEESCPPWLTDWSLEGGTLSGLLSEPGRTPDLVERLVARGVRILRVTERPVDLERIFLEIERSG